MEIMNSIEMCMFESGIAHFATDNDLKEYSHDVVFSGGFDSTLILLMLCELKKDKLKDNDINVITIDGCGAPGMVEMEKEARKNILEQVKRDYKFEINESHMSVSLNHINYKNSKSRGGGYNLQHLYLSMATMMSSEKSILYSGFNGDDHSTIFFNHLIDMIKGIDNFYLADFKTILNAPLFNFSKADIILTMKKYFPKYAKLVSTCQDPNRENDKYVACGVCEKCKEYYSAINQIKYDISKKDPDYNMMLECYVDDELAKELRINSKNSCVSLGVCKDDSIKESYEKYDSNDDFESAKIRRNKNTKASFVSNVYKSIDNRPKKFNIKPIPIFTINGSRSPYNLYAKMRKKKKDDNIIGTFKVGDNATATLIDDTPKIKRCAGVIDKNY